MPSPSPKRKKKCTWSSNDDAILIATLRKAKDEGFQSESGWKPQVWARCVEALKDSPGPLKTADKIQDHFGTVKGRFNAVEALVGASGFGWDDGLKMVTATEETILKHPDAKRWRKSPFPLYEDVLYLVKGIIATGAGAFHAGTIQTQAESSTSQTQPDPETQTQTQSVDGSQAPVTPTHLKILQSKTTPPYIPTVPMETSQFCYILRRKSIVLMIDRQIPVMGISDQYTI
ncbi:hypothetical protein B0H13DRAFT_1892632 [Mycena leptocephala]|nr:hypothetical protein B0H13DRAFT_1892632 [Mycena leptocephala]